MAFHRPYSVFTCHWKAKLLTNRSSISLCTYLRHIFLWFSDFIVRFTILGSLKVFSYHTRCCFADYFNGRAFFSDTQPASKGPTTRSVHYTGNSMPVRLAVPGPVSPLGCPAIPLSFGFIRITRLLPVVSRFPARVAVAGLL